jgi:polyketide synthase PksJ
MAMGIFITMHHSIFDGWSFDIFFSEISQLYSFYSYKKPCELSGLKSTYSDYINWQNELLSSRETQEKLFFWKKLLHDAPSLHFPLDYPRIDIQTHEGKYLPFKLEPSVVIALSNLAKSTDSSLFMVFLTVFYILIARYSNQMDCVFGIPVAGRNAPNTNNLIGYFTNILAIRIQSEKTTQFKELLNQLKKLVLEIYDNQDIPFGKIVEQLNIKRDLSRNPLFQILFAYQNIGLSTLSLDETTIIPCRNGYDAARFDFTFEIEDRANSIQGGVYYNTALFSEKTIEYMLTSFHEILEQIIETPEVQISDFSLLNEKPRIELINKLNKSDFIASEKEFFMKDFFETQVKLHPEQTAVKYDGNEITYNTLNLKANQLINFLYERNIKQGSIIGIGTGRCLELIVSIISCFKGGFVYVPLDIDYPKERLSYIAKNSSVSAIITVTKHSDIFSGFNIDLIDLEKNVARINEQSIAPPKITLKIHEPAYIFYTSGTTGTPKGSLISRFNIVNLIESTKKLFNLSKNDKIILFHSYAFDVALWEIFSALCFGATLFIPKKEDILSVNSFYNLLVNEKISVLNETPSAFEQLLFYEKEFGSKKLKLRYIILAGEALKPKTIKTWFNTYGENSSKIINMYGITETTIYSTYLEVTNSMTDSIRSNIGRGIPGVALYILDEKKQLLPPNITGEIYVAGHGVGQGYLNLPELTSQKFLDAPPELSHLSKKIYKTGDLGRYSVNGDIEYLGRIDNQVKIRGYRIELEEIESIIINHPFVNEVLVVVQKGDAYENSDFLVAYIIPTTDAPKEELKKELNVIIENKLPHYMKAQIAFLESFPLMINNKIDRNKLPKISYITQSAISNLPTTELEIKIAQLWEKILHIKITDIDISFFNMGGNSLFAMQLHSKLVETYKINLKIVDLFNYSNIRKLAKFIETSNASIKNPSSPLAPSPSVMTKDTENVIAIIGMAGKFPKAGNLDIFWENIKNGKDCIDRYTKDTLIKEGIPSSLVMQDNFIPATGVLENIDFFDADFFNFSPKEASLTDPQHRLFLETAFNALANAGYSSEKGTHNISIYAGMGDNDYFNSILSNQKNEYSNRPSIGLKIANDKDYLATKIAYKLNFQGPAINVNTACSTSLVAVIKACQSLLAEESYMALAGGISLILPDNRGYLYESGSIFSKDGLCRSLDQNSTGTVPSSGVGIVVLKKLSNAIKDGDTIHATINGYGINNDGADKISFPAPSLRGQINCIHNALEMAKVHPRDISYIETHGTGTVIGDAIEIQALTETFKNKTDKEHFCALGSVKNNIGHAQAASGIAGLLKTIFILKEQFVPPHINFETPNSMIDIDESPFFVNSEKKNLKGKVITAGVSSFGVGGTNAHLILKNYISSHESTADEYKLFIISAKDYRSLDSYRQKLKEFLQHKKDEPQIYNDYIDDVAYTLQAGRDDFSFRKAWICTDIEDAILKLGNNKEPIVCDFNQNNANFLKLYTFAENWLEGHEIKWSELHKEKRNRVPLPTYPFNYKSYWYNPLLPFNPKNAIESSLVPKAKLSDATLSSEKILSIIQKSLGHDSIKRTDNFISIGGDSLILIDIISKIEAQFGCKVPFELFLKGNDLNSVILEIINLKELNNLSVPLKKLKDGNQLMPPVFLIHPGNGSLYAYEPFVAKIEYEGSIWGIQNSIFDRTYKPFNSIENMATYYINIIKTIQPDGHYFLAGWSLGASVAFEITRQLEEKGQTVSNLTLIDGWYKYNPRLHEDDFFYNLHKKEFQSIEEGNRSFIINLLMTRFNLFMEYHPRPIRKNISLIKAKELTEEFNVSDPYNNWKPFSTSEIEVFLVEGDHLSMFSAENVNHLAKVYSTILKKNIVNETKNV